MSIADALGKLLDPDSPWLVYLAGVLLVAAAGVGRRLTTSLQRIGARLGAAERELAEEQIRRRQLEHHLRDVEGCRLPFWPPDGPTPAPPIVREDQDQDQAGDLRTRHNFRPPVPPAASVRR